MATYKVIQDIEAEDHLLGPLSFRQFIYALVCVFCLYISFICVTKGVAFLLVLFLPPAIFTGFFAFPFGQDQPTEVWALAKIRFYFKPRRRIWNQSGVKELVSITVPKKVERVYTNGLSETEVKSRLSALADTIDSRGWAIKNVNVNLYARPNPFAAQDDGSDRLVAMSSLPQAVPDDDIQASDDILDERANPVAQQFDQMISASSRAHRKQLVDELNDVRAQVAPVVAQPATPNPDYWFGRQNALTTAPAIIDDKQPTAAEQAAIERAKIQNDNLSLSVARMHTVQPRGADGAWQVADNSSPITDSQPPTTPSLSAQPTAAAGQPPAAGATASDAAILNLAHNDDLNVATLAREAHKAKNPGDTLQDEVVISLR